METDVFAKRKKINKIILSVIFGILMVWIIIGVATCGGEEKKPKAFFTTTQGWITAKDFVTAKLKSPSTADFPSQPLSYRMEGDSVIVMKGYVDSQNSFGAEIRTTFLIGLKFYGGDWVDNRNWEELYFQVVE